MYSFIDKGKEDISLRSEGTAGITRSFIENKMDRVEGLKYKVYYYGSMFRYEQPQKGRFREFRQFGAESFGNAKVQEDFLMILMLDDIFKELGIKSKLKINSLGCNDCNPKYKKELLNFVEPKKTF